MKKSDNEYQSDSIPGIFSIRDDKGFWQKVESYIQSHSDIKFSHSLCNDCIREMYPDDADKIIKELESDEGI